MQNRERVVRWRIMDANDEEVYRGPYAGVARAWTEFGCQPGSDRLEYQVESDVQGSAVEHWERTGLLPASVLVID